ncbi:MULTISPECIES: hypothetical protein [Rhodopirellula]|uniref:hypothetical protein n=1 Tax=Rhodopirellula TaxID=265488 RepID=UPI001181BB35|nr:hypothetical protein [Rhodopirellula europaea]
MYFCKFPASASLDVPADFTIGDGIRGWAFSGQWTTLPIQELELRRNKHQRWRAEDFSFDSVLEGIHKQNRRPASLPIAAHRIHCRFSLQELKNT